MTVLLLIIATTTRFPSSPEVDELRAQLEGRFERDPECGDPDGGGGGRRFAEPEVGAGHDERERERERERENERESMRERE